MKMISFKQLHEKTLSEHKKIFVKMDVVSYYLWRPICDFLSILLLKTKITANTVTILSFYSCVISLCVFIFMPTYNGALLGYFFFWIWNISDGIDGNIARYTGTCSKSGDLWDAVAGYAAMIVVFLGAGIYSSNEASMIIVPFMNDKLYVLLGAISAIFTIFPRLVIQKKECVFGKKSSQLMKDRSTFGLFKVIAVNIVSINGLCGFLLLLAIIFGFTNIFTILYFVIMLLFAICSMYSIMKGIANE